MAHIEVVEGDEDSGGCDGCAFLKSHCNSVLTYLKDEHGLQGCGIVNVTYRLHGCTLEEFTDALEVYNANKQKV